MEIKVLNNNTPLPQHESDLAAGVDLKITSFQRLFKGTDEVDITKFLDYSMKNGYLTLRGHERVLCGTGLFLEIPEGYRLEVIPRSGVALKRGLTVVNTPGTIDADYRGEVGIILINTTPYLNRIEIGERLAQAVLSKFERIEWIPIESLEETQRGAGGFGHSGTK